MLFLSVLFFLQSCGVPKVTVKVLRPPDLDLKGIEKIAVADFQGPGWSGSQAASMLTAKLFDAGRFQIVEREKLAGVLEEQALSLSGVVDKQSAAEVGKILGVDAIVYGEVTSYQTGDPIEGSKFRKVVKSGEYKKEEVVSDQPYRVRTATVGIGFRIVDVNTGQLKMARTGSASIRPEDELSGVRKALYVLTGMVVISAAIAVLSKVLSQEKPEEGEDEERASPFPPPAEVPPPPPPPLLPEDEILNDLMGEVVDAFVTQIAPHYEMVTRTLEEDGGLVKMGVEYAQNGLWKKARVAWKEAIRLSPDDDLAHYNLGVAYEVQGELRLAAEEYEKALSIKPREPYMRALVNVRELIKEQERYEK